MATWTASRRLGRPHGPQAARTAEDLLRRLPRRAEGAGGDVSGVLVSEGGSDAASGGDSRVGDGHRRCAERVAKNPLPTSGSPLALCRCRPPPTSTLDLSPSGGGATRPFPCVAGQFHRRHHPAPARGATANVDAVGVSVVLAVARTASRRKAGGSAASVADARDACGRVLRRGALFVCGSDSEPIGDLRDGSGFRRCVKRMAEQSPPPAGGALATCWCQSPTTTLADFPPRRRLIGKALGWRATSNAVSATERRAAAPPEAN